MSEYTVVPEVEIISRNHDIFHDKEDVMSKIRENEADIKRMRQRLFGMCCATPKDTFQNDDDCDDNLVESIAREFDTIFDDDYYETAAGKPTHFSRGMKVARI